MLDIGGFLLLVQLDAHADSCSGSFIPLLYERQLGN
jgi:hypothetical protein